jgi:hypothetical protein
MSSENLANANKILACGTIGTGEKIFDVDPELSSG